MTNRLKGLANGRVLAVLEGGYSQEKTSLAAEATVRVRTGVK